MSLASGTRLGPYEIQAAIGAGGMGEIYRARDTRLGRTVAIKVLPAGVASDPERRRRFEQEARAASALNHPHICVLHDIGREGDVDYLVMEHLEGESLAARLAKGALPADRALQVGIQIADALAAAHKQGIVHRDLKPGNIVLTKTGAKLLDFGLAKLKAPGPSEGVAESSLQTEASPATEPGTVFGTLPYMAPEQLEGRDADARSDLFAFGAVLYEMLAGRRAFDGASPASVISAVMTSQPPLLSSFRVLAPPALEHVVRKCLSKDPEERWESAHDVAEELRWISQPGELAARATASPPGERTRKRILPAAFVLLAATAAAAALWASGVWNPLRRASGPPAVPLIAVLPLENLSGDPSQEYFADGLTDSLITELAQIRSLRVISRTSAMRYKGTRKPVKEVARELNGATAIVEGTVMRDAGRVAVSVQLIDTLSDAPVWSQSYDRELTDILSLRREIARSVATGIRAVMQPDDERRLSRRDQVNPNAFDAYLRAVDFRQRGATEASLRASLSAAQEAVSLDASFAEAYAELSMANASLWWYYYDHSPTRANEARAAADKALELAPQLPEAHRAKGIILYHLDLDYDRALKELSLAIEANPSDADALAWIGYVRRRQGMVDETVTYLRRALALDPQAASLSFNLGETYALLRRPDDAERVYNEALRQNPVYNRPFAYRLRWRLRLRPELAQARDVERQAEAAGLGSDPIILYHRVLLHMFAGDHEKALDLLSAPDLDTFEESFWCVPIALLQGQIHARAGQSARARQCYSAAQRVSQEKLRLDAGDSRGMSALGLALAGLGDKAGAVRAGQAAVDAMPLTRDAYRGAVRLEDLARIYAAVGDRDAAVEILEKLLTVPFDLAAPALAVDPAWAPLRGHPGFERLIASAR